MTIEQLRLVMPKVSEKRAATHGVWILAAMAEFHIDTIHQQAMFVAQCAHESAELRFYTELWGPTEWQKKYEGNKQLGNTFPGDGYRYRGRGAIQVTGRYNYQLFGTRLGLDLLSKPTLAAEPEPAARVAGSYFQFHGLIQLAEAGTEPTFRAVTKKINPGLLGYPQRLAYYKRALEVLGEETMP